MPIGKYIRLPRGSYNPRKPILVIGPSIAYIPLTKGMFSCVDSDDAMMLGTNNWFAHTYRGRIYAQRRAESRGRIIGMHEVLCLCPNGSIPDHKNNESLDNRRANLRPATSGQNKTNCKIRSDSKTGVKGVMRQANGTFTAYTGQGGKVKSHGTFKTIEEAAAMYRLKSSELYGAFARY